MSPLLSRQIKGYSFNDNQGLRKEVAEALSDFENNILTQAGDNPALVVSVLYPREAQTQYFGNGSGIDDKTLQTIGTELVNRSGNMLRQIVDSSSDVSTLVSEIAAASQEQSDGIQQVNRAVVEMDNITQQNAALVEEAAAASEAMGVQAQQLKELVAFFLLSDQDVQGSTATEATAPAIQEPGQTTHNKTDQRNIAPVTANKTNGPLEDQNKIEENDWSEF